MRLSERVLDLARWAPSGDNTQPWRFEIRSDTEFLVHGYDTRAHCVYDLDGAASQVAHGALLETAALAATRVKCRAEVSMLSADPSGHIVYRVLLVPDPKTSEDPLVAAITERVVQRRPLSTRALSAAQKSALEDAVRPHRVVWMETLGERWCMAALNAFSAHIRLTIPEAFAVHKETIDWDATTSEDRMPAPALGAPGFLVPMMRTAMASWERVDFFNRYLGGTVMPRVFLDWLPGVRCSAHFALVAPDIAKQPADYVAAGRATQRFWLTATSLGFQVQPTYTPLVFANFAREERNFTIVEAAKARAKVVAARLDTVFGAESARRAVFLGRLGPKRSVNGRSIRKPLEKLIVTSAPQSV
jgi:nitroreductase